MLSTPSSIPPDCCTKLLSIHSCEDPMSHYKEQRCWGFPTCNMHVSPSSVWGHSVWTDWPCEMARRIIARHALTVCFCWKIGGHRHQLLEIPFLYRFCTATLIVCHDGLLYCFSNTALCMKQGLVHIYRPYCIPGWSSCRLAAVARDHGDSSGGQQPASCCKLHLISLLSFWLNNLMIDASQLMQLLFLQPHSR